MNKKQTGFTIVELLIVIVVIAILAAITIVSYNGITARAQTSAALNTLRNASQKYQAYLAEKGTAPTTPEYNQLVTDVSGEISLSSFTLTVMGRVTEFCIQYSNDAETINYFANSTDKKSPTKGYCDSSGSGQYTLQ